MPAAGPLSFFFMRFLENNRFYIVSRKGIKLLPLGKIYGSVYRFGGI
jgi:hypothetical protein